MIRPFVAWRFRRGFSAGLLWMPPDRRWQWVQFFGQGGLAADHLAIEHRSRGVQKI